VQCRRFRKLGSQINEETALDAAPNFDRLKSHGTGIDAIKHIASNILRHHVRHERARRSAYERLPQQRSFEPDPQLEERLVALSLDAPLRNALGSLRLEDRDVLWLFAVAQLNYEEIGLALGIPVGTVRSRLNRARARIRLHPALREAMRHSEDHAIGSIGGADGRS